MRTAFSLPAGRTANSYVASGAGLGRGLGTAGHGGLTRKDLQERKTAAGRVVTIAIPNSVPHTIFFMDRLNQDHLMKRGYCRGFGWFS